ncbi:Pyridoxine/pyridoxamine 5'-phosphate oxidase [Rhodococcus sp. RD6.2]|uniref:pyridoxamine 5'-phosphate oxidase n=1 Tax=Rhodococcus sp. RD6.2 TaxID=260936 RepID=UPI00063B0D43|nr:pyridoxamine 5'-phosphate oxidase [Rhodococcus sp. RD6.2]CRK53635.1 Pyridoxine/pyridoxamine 5'-phosphate oxidase [Rhodococcus sp. RD6.2]
MPSDAEVPADQRSADPVDLSAMRVAYATQESNSPAPELNLDVATVADGWFVLLQRWIDQARAAGTSEPNAMVLATVDADGRPASRTVLCKGLSEEGLVFYTNHGSNKGRQLERFPYASATFAWTAFAHQVTVRGEVSRVPDEVTDAYWRTRPRGSQLGAWASDQSEPIESRSALDARLVEVTERFADLEEVPRLPGWGGFLLRPSTVEFWQGRANRMHNRVIVTRGEAGWSAQRLQP